jgi:hypothetical protein
VLRQIITRDFILGFFAAVATVIVAVLAGAGYHAVMSRTSHGCAVFGSTAPQPCQSFPDWTSGSWQPLANVATLHVLVVCGGGGILINGTGPTAQSGSPIPANCPCGQLGQVGGGGTGNGAGGGGSANGHINGGGNGAPGVVYVEW